MPETFVVEVSYVPPVLPPQALEGLALKFKTSPEKMGDLLGRLPGVVTKPVSEGEAAVIAGYFESAGLGARVKSNDKQKRHSIQTQGLPSQQQKIVSIQESEQRVGSFVKAEPAEFFKKTPPPDLKINLDHFAKPLRSLSAVVEEQGSQALPSFDNARAGRSSRRRVKKVKIYAAPVPSEEKRSGSLRHKLVRALFVSTLVAGIGCFLVVLAYQWFGLQDRAFESAALATVASASHLSRVLETTGNVSQLTRLPIPVPEQSNLRAQFVIARSTNNVLAQWPNQELLSDALQARVATEAEQALLKANTVQSVLAANDALNTFGSRLILTAHPLEHGTALVGAVVSAYTYEPLMTQFGKDLLIVALLALLPFLLAFLLGWLSIRRLTKALFVLIERAEAVSKGQLQEPIKVKTDDELSDLADSLERLRIGTQASLERLRERRDTSF